MAAEAFEAFSFDFSIFSHRAADVQVNVTLCKQWRVSSIFGSSLCCIFASWWRRSSSQPLVSAMISHVGCWTSSFLISFSFTCSGSWEANTSVHTRVSLVDVMYCSLLGSIHNVFPCISRLWCVCVRGGGGLSTTDQYIYHVSTHRAG